MHIGGCALPVSEEDRQRRAALHRMPSLGDRDLRGIRAWGGRIDQPPRAPVYATRAAAMAMRGLDVDTIVTVLGCSRKTANKHSRAARAAGITPPAPVTDRGIAMAAMRERGATLQVIADRFGISGPAVCKALRRHARALAGQRGVRS